MADHHGQNSNPEPLCAPPPLDHLKTGESAPVAVSTVTDETTFDRKHGNPGPRVKAYGVENPEPEKDAQNQPEERNEMPEEPKQPDVADENPDEETLTPEQNRKVMEAWHELRLIFPDLKDNWLRRTIIQGMIRDKFDVDQTVNWIYEYENLAPRKEAILKKQAALMRMDNYESMRKVLKETKHEVTEEYKYFAEVKLTQKFPQFAIYSLRQVLNDCDYMYPLAVLNIMEGLERHMQTDKRMWKDWKINELIYITMQKPSDGKWYKYPMCVVKGNKYWCKKKAKMTPFPGALAQQVRIVEKALAIYEKRFRAMKARLDAEAEHRARLATAIEIGAALECPVCTDFYLPEEQVTCTEGHIFCLNCLQGTVKEAVSGQLYLSPQGELQCIASGCSGFFPLTMLCHMLQPEIMALFEERLWTDFLAKSGIPNLHKCPNCGYAEEVETPVEVLKLFECRNPRCRQKSCRECGSDWKEHTGKPCKEMQMGPEQALKKKYEEMMCEVLIRRCFQCKRPQIKNDGCNKLTCLCGAKMCYLCRKPIQEYTHFCQHGTVPGERCKECSKCVLFEDPDGTDVKLREKLELQLQEELLELRLQLEKKSQALAAKMSGSATPVISTTPVPSSVEEQPVAQQQQQVPVPIAPAQRQFAAIFGQ